jgi:hypothetical protein
VQFCTLLQALIRLYGDSRHLNSFTASLHLQQNVPAVRKVQTYTLLQVPIRLYGGRKNRADLQPLYTDSTLQNAAVQSQKISTNVSPAEDIVAYRPFDRQRLRNKQLVQKLLCDSRISKRPFLSNGSVNMFPRKREAHNNIYNENWGVSYVFRARVLKSI